MRLVIQRVTEASVKVDGEIVGAIQNGLMILVGIEDADNHEDIEWLAGKASNLRIFDDEATSLRHLFLETPFCGRTPSQWGGLPAAVLLFLSMLPLHEDSPLRQSMLLANAMRLFAEIDQ